MVETNKKIIGYLVSGGRELNKTTDRDLISDIEDYIRKLEQENKTKYDERTRLKLMKLLLGIIKKEGFYDERRHKWLIGLLE